MDGLEKGNTEGRMDWGALAPCEHVLQIYNDDATFLDAIEGFAIAGLDAGESVVVIATASHREGILQRLAEAGVDLDRAIAEDRFVALSAQETLDRFMLRGAPDETLFEMVIGEVLERARGTSGRKVRAFGEMVALLWARGNQPAAVRLEYLWNRLLRRERFPLFCAYPRFGFTEELVLSVDAVCKAHTRILA